MRPPLIVGVGGAHSGIGKTETAAALLRYLTNSNSKDSDKLQVTSNELKTNGKDLSLSPDPLLVAHNSSLVTYKRWGAIKYTRTEFYSSITDDASILTLENKDTARLLEAGADEVLWVQAPPQELREVLPLALEKLSGLSGIIVEGNSAIEFLKPDIVIFLVDGNGGRFKPSAYGALEAADIILDRRGNAPRDIFPGTTALCSLPLASFDENTVQGLIQCMESVMGIKNVKELLRERSSGGNIACSDARKIAEELDVPYKEVGKAANQMQIKIKSCELGCF